ncbi:MAG: nucleoside triphosphate pyrophosphohydrolase [Candidatus Cryptobacteroides sp.]
MHSTQEKLDAFAELLEVMDALREKCPWNAAQTMESIRPMTEEEVYELSDAILKGDESEISKEIGDLLYHMVFYARIAQESGAFDIADCLHKICEKMRFRHPHVFGELAGKELSAEEIADTWELVKAKEKGGNKTVLSGIPQTMPSLLKALSMQEKLRGCGLDRQSVEKAQERVERELAEMKNAEGEKEREEAAGDLLFAVINLSRLQGVDPDKALNLCCDKFRKNFTELEEDCLAEGRPLKDIAEEDLEKLY